MLLDKKWASNGDYFEVSLDARSYSDAGNDMENEPSHVMPRI